MNISLFRVGPTEKCLKTNTSSLFILQQLILRNEMIFYSLNHLNDESIINN